MLSSFSVLSLYLFFIQLLLTRCFVKCGPNDQMYTLIRDHVEAIVANPYCSRAYIVLALEINYGREAGHIWKDLMGRWQIEGKERIRPVYGQYVDPARPGILTTNPSKKRWASALRNHMENGSLLLAKDLVVANRYVNRHNRQALTIEKYREQLHRYRNVAIETENAASDNKVILSGKVNIKGKKDSSVGDDMAIASTWTLGTCDDLRNKKLEHFDYSIIKSWRGR